MPIFDLHSYLGGSLVPGVAASPAGMVEVMQERGVDASLVFSARARVLDPLAGNRILRAMIDQAPNLYGCLVTHVNRVEESITAMRELMASRKFVAMAVVASRDGEGVTKAVADEIVNAYRRYTKPLFLYTPNARAVEQAVEIARAFPMLKVIFLGMGGTDWREAVAAAHSVTNIYLETSGALDRTKLRFAVDLVGAHRIVFGSGAPHVDPAAVLGLLEDADISPDARRRIQGDNASRLLGIDLHAPAA